jgi:hypothetical protein
MMRASRAQDGLAVNALREAQRRCHQRDVEVAGERTKVRWWLCRVRVFARHGSRNHKLVARVRQLSAQWDAPDYLFGYG